MSSRAAELRRAAEVWGTRAGLAAVLAGGPGGDAHAAEQAARLTAVAVGLARAAVLVAAWEAAEAAIGRVPCLYCGELLECGPSCPYHMTESWGDE